MKIVGEIDEIGKADLWAWIVRVKESLSRRSCDEVDLSDEEDEG